MPYVKPDPTCGSWGRQHSGASQACIWHAVQLMDVHSLLRQSFQSLRTLMQARDWTRPPPGHNANHDKLCLIVYLLGEAVAPATRCGLGLPTEARRVVDAEMSWLQRPVASSAALGMYSHERSCAPVEFFDNAQLPYRWLPGLPLREPPSNRELRSAPRIEVMHLADMWPGPVWMYAAPGSGVWWDPGRRVVAVNLVDAILKFHPMRTVLDHLSRIRNGDRRFAQYRNYVQWHAAFGNNVSWERVLTLAASGEEPYSFVSAAGELLSALLVRDEHRPTGVDSIILLRQMHYWPRGRGWGSADDNFAPTMVAPCAADAAAVGRRVRYVTEIIDYRAMRAAKPHKKSWPVWRSDLEIPPALYDSLSSR